VPAVLPGVVVGEDPVERGGDVAQVEAVEADRPGRVRRQREGVDADVGEGDGDGVDDRDVVRPRQPRLPELALEAVAVVQGPVERIAHGLGRSFLTPEPLAVPALDAAALDLEADDRLLGLREDEVDLPVTRAEAAILGDPGDRVEDLPIVGKVVAQEGEDPLLGGARRLPGKDLAGAHARHGGGGCQISGSARDSRPMHIDALLGFDLVAVKSQDRITVLLELAAPQASSRASRAPSTLQVVLHRSGSMGGGPLAAAQEGLDRLLVRLDPSDSFGLVFFDDRAEVTVPTAPLTDKAAVRAAVAGVFVRGMANLSGGYLRGLREARRAGGDRGATLLLLSDGHANEGVVDHAQLERIARDGRSHAVTTSTLGLGLGYDEALLASLAWGGAGDAHFAEGRGHDRRADRGGRPPAGMADELADEARVLHELEAEATAGDANRVAKFSHADAHRKRHRRGRGRGRR